LTSVEYKKGLTSGEITLLTAGVQTRFNYIPRIFVDTIIQTICGRMAVVSNGTDWSIGDGTANLSLTPVSVADELIKLANLRNIGLLTSVEFDEQKAKLPIE
jgi:hypothetical protein